MKLISPALDDSCTNDNVEGSSRIRTGRKRVDYDDNTRNYKSKNLHAERRRRQKLSDRLLALRSIVPIISNAITLNTSMKKASIIEDAITYIQELQRDVKVLSDQLVEMEVSSEEETKTRNIDMIDAAEEMKKNGIKEDVQVNSVDGNKLWIKIVLEKKRGRFTRLIEAMTCFGLELTDTTVTTSKGACLVSSCVQSTYGYTLAVHEIKELLVEIIRGL